MDCYLYHLTFGVADTFIFCETIQCCCQSILAFFNWITPSSRLSIVEGNVLNKDGHLIWWSLFLIVLGFTSFLGLENWSVALMKHCRLVAYEPIKLKSRSIPPFLLLFFTEDMVSSDRLGIAIFMLVSVSASSGDCLVVVEWPSVVVWHISSLSKCVDTIPVCGSLLVSTKNVDLKIIVAVKKIYSLEQWYIATIVFSNQATKISFSNLVIFAKISF